MRSRLRFLADEVEEELTADQGATAVEGILQVVKHGLACPRGPIRDWAVEIAPAWIEAMGADYVGELAEICIRIGDEVEDEDVTDSELGELEMPPPPPSSPPPPLSRGSIVVIRLPRQKPSSTRASSARISRAGPFVR